MQDSRAAQRRDPPPPAPVADRLPVLPPWQAIAELAVLTALILGIDWLLPTVDLADMQPNPFWFPLLLLSLQYGTVSGVMAAGVAVLATMLSGVPEQGVGENHFAYLLRVWAQPMLWIGAAVFFGQFRMRQIAAKQELQRSVTELASQRSALAEYSTNLRNRCDALERELVAHPPAPALALLDGIAALQAGSEPDRALGLAIEAIAPRAAASLFAVEDGALRRVAATGWPGVGKWRSEIPGSHPLYRSVVGSAHPVSVAETGGEASLDGEGLAAVPVLSSDGARALGMLKIEHAEPRLVDAALTRRLAAVAAALAPALEGRMRVAGATVAASAAPVQSVASRPRQLVRWQPPGRRSSSGAARASKATTVS